MTQPPSPGHDSRFDEFGVDAAKIRREANPGILVQLQRAILVAAGAAITILVMVQIITRYFFGFSIYGIEELATFVAVWLYFIGGSHGAWSREHISASLIDFLLSPGPLQQSLRIIASTITVIVSAWMTVWATQYLLTSIRRGLMSLEVGIPLAYVNVAMPIGLALMTVYFFIQLIDEVSVLRRGLGR